MQRWGAQTKGHLEKCEDTFNDLQKPQRNGMQHALLGGKHQMTTDIIE